MASMRAPLIAALSLARVIIPVMEPAVFTVKVTPLLAWLLTVTTTGPVVAPDGTGAEMLLAFQLVGEAVVPLNVTVLVPWLEPKVVPVMVTAVPIGPDVGERLSIFGLTVNVAP